MAEIKHLQRVGGLVRLKLDSNHNAFSLFEDSPRDSFRDIERGSLGLYVGFHSKNEIKGIVACEILLFRDQLFAIPSAHADKWFEAI